MLKYITAINVDRKRLPKGLRFVTDLLAVTAIAIGAGLAVYLYRLCLWPHVCASQLGEGMASWLMFAVVFFGAVTVGQLCVLGTVGVVLVAKGNLTPKEAARYAVLYRMPRSWLDKGR